MQFLAFTCGLLSGALANLGVHCHVTAEVDTMPACELGGGGGGHDHTHMQAPLGAVGTCNSTIVR